MKSKLPIRPLKGYNCFAKVFENGKRFYVENLLLVIINKDNELIIKKSSQTDICYYGVGSSRKINKKAVVRNRNKRLLRESIRQLFMEKEINLTNMKYCVLLYNKRVIHPKLIKLKDVKPLVKEAFDKAKIYYNSNNSLD